MQLPLHPVRLPRGTATAAGIRLLLEFYRIGVEGGVEGGPEQHDAAGRHAATIFPTVPVGGKEPNAVAQLGELDK